METECIFISREKLKAAEFPKEFDQITTFSKGHDKKVVRVLGFVCCGNGDFKQVFALGMGKISIFNFSVRIRDFILHFNLSGVKTDEMLRFTKFYPKPCYEVYRNALSKKVPTI